MGVAERREREREQRRQGILDAAEAVFVEQGASNATMDDVARAAELSKGTLYLYFSSKDALLMGIAVRSLSLLVTRVESLGAGENGLQRLQAFMRTHRGFVLEHPDRFRAILAWIASGSHADPSEPSFARYRELSGRIFKTVVGCIEAGQRDGSIRADLHPPTATLYLWGAASGVWMLYFSQHELGARLPTPVDFEHLLATQADMVLRALRTPQKPHALEPPRHGAEVPAVAREAEHV